MCPTCARANAPHCVHQAAFRNAAAQMKLAREAPSEVRQKLCERLWKEVCDGPDADAICTRMSDRAQNGIQRDE